MNGWQILVAVVAGVLSAVVVDVLILSSDYPSIGAVAHMRERLLVENIRTNELLVRLIDVERGCHP